MGGAVDTRTPVTPPGSSWRGRVLGKTHERAWCAVEVLLRFPFDAIIDFLVEDACIVCGRARRCRLKNDRPMDAPIRYLVEPVSVRCLFGAVGVVNHPVCSACASDFAVARSTGVLGMASEPHTAATDRSETPRDPGGARDEEMPAQSRVEGTIAVVSPFMTTDAVLKIVHQLKFNAYTGLAGPIGRSIGWALRRFAGRSGGFGLVVPTPMDRRSEKERGFNAAERIARVLAADLESSMATSVLHKTVRTERQSQTPREMRAANVRGAFSCPAEAAPLLAGRPVVLVDDLVTSGATAAVCATALIAGGASSVTVASFGRAL